MVLLLAVNVPTEPDELMVDVKALGEFLDTTVEPVGVMTEE